jgi:hypothetical protein
MNGMILQINAITCGNNWKKWVQYLRIIN